MLEVGNGGMTTTEYRAHFSLWCLLAAPLMAGNDLKSMPAEIKEILTNKEVIAVDQDPLGMEGRRVRKNGDSEVWAKQMKDDSRAVVSQSRCLGRRSFCVLGRPRLSSSFHRSSPRPLGQEGPRQSDGDVQRQGTPARGRDAARHTLSGWLSFRFSAGDSG